LHPAPQGAPLGGRDLDRRLGEDERALAWEVIERGEMAADGVAELAEGEVERLQARRARAVGRSEGNQLLLLGATGGGSAEGKEQREEDERAQPDPDARIAGEFHAATSLSRRAHSVRHQR